LKNQLIVLYLSVLLFSSCGCWRASATLATAGAESGVTVVHNRTTAQPTRTHAKWGEKNIVKTKRSTSLFPRKHKKKLNIKDKNTITKTKQKRFSLCWSEKGEDFRTGNHTTGTCQPNGRQTNCQPLADNTNKKISKKG
jgi:hypothetical protein